MSASAIGCSAAHEVVGLDRGEATGGDRSERAFEVGLQLVLDREQLDGSLDRHWSLLQSSVTCGRFDPSEARYHQIPPRGSFHSLDSDHARAKSGPRQRGAYAKGDRPTTGDPRPRDRGLRRARRRPHQSPRDRARGRRHARGTDATTSAPSKSSSSRSTRRAIVPTTGRTPAPRRDPGRAHDRVRPHQPRGPWARAALLDARRLGARRGPPRRAGVRHRPLRPGSARTSRPTTSAISREGRIRGDLDPDAVAALIVAASDGLQTQWLLDDAAPQHEALALLDRLLRPAE